MSAALAPIHLRPVAAIADRVLLPGDPGRALALAQTVLGDDRRMANHHRGLWGYTGTGPDGAPLTIQSTGIGGPSAAVVLAELAALGVRSAVRIGTGSAVAEDVTAGALVAAAEVLGEDGTSLALGGPARRSLDGELAAALGTAAGSRVGLVASSDLFYEPDAGRLARRRAAGVLACDLQTAALAAVAERLGVRFGALLAVAADAAGRLSDDAVADLAEAMGHAAAAALEAL